MGFSEPLGRFYVALGVDSREFVAELERSRRALQRSLGPEAIALSQNLARAMAGTIAVMGGFAVASIKMAADMEKTETAFTTLLKSAEKAKQVLGELEEFSAATPFEFPEIAAAGRSLLAFGVGAENLTATLRQIGDVASGIGQPLGEIAEIYGKARVQGRLFMEDINQLTGRGIPVIQELAKQFRVTEGEVRKLVEGGKVNFTNLQQAFADLTKAGGMFAGGMEAQSKTILGQWSTLKENLVSIMRSVGMEISRSIDLNASMASAGAAVQKLAAEVKTSGLGAALDKAVGAEKRAAISATAGAITGAMIPAINLMAIAWLKALVPLRNYLVVGAALGLLVEKLIELQSETNRWEDYTRKQEKALSDMGWVGVRELNRIKLAALEAERATLGSVQSLTARLGEIQQMLSQYSGTKLGSPMAKALEQESRGIDLALGRITELDGQIRSARDGVEFFGTSAERSFNRVHQAGMRLIGIAAGLAGGIRAATPKAEDGSSSATGAGASAGNGGRDRAMDDAKRVSQSIAKEWLSTTRTKKEQLDAWFREEMAALEKSKSLNKDYLLNQGQLWETYSTRLRKIREDETTEAFQRQTKLQQKEAEMADQRGEAIRRQIEQEAEAASTQAQQLEMVRTGQAIQDKLAADWRAGDLAAYIKHLNAKDAAFMASLEGRREMISVYQQMDQEAHRTELSYLAEGYRTVYANLTTAITGVVMGSKSAGQALKEMGAQLVEMVVKWMVQRRLAATMAASIERTAGAASMSTAAMLANAWAPAAAMVSAATFGASTAAAATGLTALTALTRGLAIPGLADGGIVTRPTLAMIGEGRGPEAVIPLDRLQGMGGAPRVTVNVHNQTGVAANVRQESSFDGQEFVINVVLDGVARNKGGLRDVLRGI